TGWQDALIDSIGPLTRGVRRLRCERGETNVRGAGTFMALIVTTSVALTGVQASSAGASPGKHPAQPRRPSARVRSGPAAPGYQPVGWKLVAKDGTFDPGSQGFAEVTCPRGTVVYSGGGSGLGLPINSTYPDGDHAWANFVDNTTSSVQDFTVEAVCAKRTA